jgi:predicted ATP-dependent Lon-type protease
MSKRKMNDEIEVGIIKEYRDLVFIKKQYEGVLRLLPETETEKRLEIEEFLTDINSRIKETRKKLAMYKIIQCENSITANDIEKKEGKKK